MHCSRTADNYSPTKLHMLLQTRGTSLDQTTDTVAVTLSNRGRSIETYELLDSVSQNTKKTQNIADSLQV